MSKKKLLKKVHKLQNQLGNLEETVDTLEVNLFRLELRLRASDLLTVDDETEEVEETEDVKSEQPAEEPPALPEIEHTGETDD